MGLKNKCSRHRVWNIVKKSGSRNPGPTFCNGFSKDLILIAAGPGKGVTLAARVRHDVVVLAFRRVGVLEDRALTGPDDIEDVGCYVAFGHGALPVLVEVQVVHGHRR